MQLRARTDEFRKQYLPRAKTRRILVPAFATVREAAGAPSAMRHFDVQLIGGMVLNRARSPKCDR
jgi:preprotein translocase subunit SecA